MHVFNTTVLFGCAMYEKVDELSLRYNKPILLTVLGKENHCKLQARVSTCNGLKNAVFTEYRTEIYFVQSLQA